RPWPVGDIAGGAVGDAGFAQMAVGGGKAALDLARRKGGKGIEKPAPGRPRLAVGGEIFVGNAGKPGVIAGPQRNAALARPRLAVLSLLAALCATLSLAGLSHHPTLQNFRTSSMAERRPQVEGQREFQRAFFRRRIDFSGG